MITTTIVHKHESPAAVRPPSPVSRLPSAAPLRERWFYLSTNLQVNTGVATIRKLFQKAAKDGYNGVALNDYKFTLLSKMGKRYFNNVRAVRAIAKKDHIQIIPCVFPMGYSGGLLANDPNLAEGLPVRNALFVVHHGIARLVADPPVALPATFAQWHWHDKIVKITGPVDAHFSSPKGADARLLCQVAVHPFRQYHIRVLVKTDRFVGHPQIAITTMKGRNLQFADLGIKPTQPWKRVDVVFNSLRASKVNVYFGCWDGKSGELWWRKPKLAEVGLLNLIRRPGAPMVVRLGRNAGQKTPGKILVEGKDFAPVRDPLMGDDPWPGSYSVYHKPPVIHTIGLPDGTRLRVSYYHAITTMDNQVMICPSSPRTMALLRDEAKRVAALFHPKAYFMQHDEIRVLNWDLSCQRRHLTPGQILAKNARACVKILRHVSRGCQIYVWSDMFDPNHNAHNHYYLVNGPLAGSWKGLPPYVHMMLWDFAARAKSMRFFAQRGHPMMIAGYYDGNPNGIVPWLKTARGFPGVTGVMYTTWQNQYKDMGKFLRDARRAVGEGGK